MVGCKNFRWPSKYTINNWWWSSWKKLSWKMSLFKPIKLQITLIKKLIYENKLAYYKISSNNSINKNKKSKNYWLVWLIRQILHQLLILINLRREMLNHINFLMVPETCKVTWQKIKFALTKTKTHVFMRSSLSVLIWQTKFSKMNSVAL